MRVPHRHRDRAEPEPGLGEIWTRAELCTKAHGERFVQTIKYECLNHFIIFGERHLRRLITEFVEHYMTERFHQGVGGQLIRKHVGPTNDNGAAGKIVRRSRLGGMLNYYHREAA
jgi:putative transposase